MIFCDSHIHLVHCEFSGEEKLFREKNDSRCITNFCFAREWEEWERDSSFSSTPGLVFKSFGIHPQACSEDFMRGGFGRELSFLEALLLEGKIDAVGECGFDFFTKEYKAAEANQEVAWKAQVELCIRYGTPLVVHLRKAMEKIFRDSRLLSRVRAVVFHSFPGTLLEAKSILNHGVNAFFSLGKPILNGKKSAIDCVGNLPLERILLETDAPYQTLKGEESTFPSDIVRVYERAAKIRGQEIGFLCEKISENFMKIMI
ncbi:MAG: TatD family hydrolase [Treponema sp.]|nr:TatD family hydrolase [Treponema sp.]